MLLSLATLLAFRAACALAPLILASVDGLVPGEVVEGELALRLDGFLTRLEGLGFSGVVGVEHEGRPILIRGYGMMDRERAIPVTPETVFCIGGLTMQFTAAAVLALQDEGKLSVADSIARYFEHVPEEKRSITLHHLLTHTSGLIEPPAGEYDLRATAQRVREWVFENALEFEPGSQFRYRNVNFGLLGMVIERVSGEPYEAFLRRRLLDPSGMSSTGYLVPGRSPLPFAIGYRNGDRWGTTLARPMLPDGPCWTLRASGGIQSTVIDVLRWHHALQGDGVLSPAAREQLETSFVDEGGGVYGGYGGVIQRSASGKKLVACNGGNSVFFAELLRFTEEGDCIFVATNAGCSMRTTMARELAAMLAGAPPRALPVTIERDRAWLERYAGEYPLGTSSALELVNLGDRLLLTGRGADAADLLLDARTMERVEQARSLAAGVFAGDDGPLLAAYAGRQATDAIREELRAARVAWAARLGAFRALGEDAARADDRGTSVMVEARFERGSAFFATEFDGARGLIAFEGLDEAPFRGLPRVELFPLSAEEFRAYRDRTGLGMTVRFELDERGRARMLELGDPPIGVPRE